ncbi:MAG: hypothetical protein H7196_03185 [candidate division SR1 bacterium]|nr:hypothetical protein [candidate division SR1 bacterium]
MPNDFEQNNIPTQPSSQYNPNNIYSTNANSQFQSQNGQDSQNNQSQQVNSNFDPQQNNYYQNIQQQLAENPYFEVLKPVENNKNLDNDKKLGKKPFLPFDMLGDFLIKRWWLLIVISVLITLITVALYTFVLRQDKPGSDYTNVEARIEGPKTLPAGSPGTWKIIIQNREAVSINQIEIKLKFDKSFKYFKKINPDPIDIGGSSYKLAKLEAVGKGTSDAIISFEGLLVGSIDEDALMLGEISYVPTPLLNKQNSRIVVPITPQRTSITASEIKADLSTSQSVIQSGNEIEITLKFQNFSEKELSDLRIKLSYPDKSFVYSSSELTLTSSTSLKLKPDDGNNIWYITSVPRLQTQILKVKGVINGAEGVKQTFVSEIGIKNGSDYSVLQTTPAGITITSQPLLITTSVDNKESYPYFSPGETLNFSLVYQNRSNQTLNNIEISASIDDPSDLIDYSTLKYGDGNLNNRIVQWRASGVKQLENLPPQAKGTLKFTAQVKKEGQFIKSGINQTAYVLKLVVDGKALNLPSTRFESSGYKATAYIHEDQKIKRIIGVSLPPTQRLYEVTWTLETAQNRVNDVVINTSTNLPPSAWNQSSVLPASMSNKLSYNPLNGNISWKPGSIESYTGISNPLVSVSFKLLVDISNGGSFSGLQIIKPVYGQGLDDVTGEKYEIKFDEYKISDQ